MYLRRKGFWVVIAILMVPLFLYGKSAVLTANKVTKPDPKMTAEEFLMSPVVRDQIQDEALEFSDNAAYNVKCNQTKDECELILQDGESEAHFTFNSEKDFVFDSSRREFGLYLHKKGEAEADFVLGQYDDDTNSIIDAEYRFPTERK